MKFFGPLWRRYTLLCLIVLTSLPLTVIGWKERDAVYKEYDFDPVKEPGLTLVLAGFHDGIYPLKDLIGRGKRKKAPDEAAEESTVSGQKTAEIPAEPKDGTAAAPSAAPSEAAAGNTYEEAGDSAVEKIELLPQNAVSGDTDTFPEGVCNPVMQAEDYDVVNVAFLSPDDTEYNTDTEGIFAKNGIYFRLETVDASYFSDALFIGDSRTVGLCEYGTLKETASFLAKESVNVYNVLDQELRYTDTEGDTREAYAEEILEENEFGKVYVALGVNELGIGTTYMYYEKYRELLELIRQYQPDALIYIQGIMHVSKEKSSSDSCRNNTVIAQRNGAISTLANGRDIFYIDINPYVCDDSGDLFPEMSGDGIHLKASAYEEWDRFLMENAAVTGGERAK